MAAGTLICPRCHQGEVLEVRVRASGQTAFLCEECEALWFDRSKIGETGFQQFTTVMESLGGKGLWSEIEVFGSVCDSR